MKTTHLILLSFIGSVALWSQDSKSSSANDYTMTPDAEVALARSAAPDKISAHATIKVLTDSGYKVAAQGDNGFTCIVMLKVLDPFFKNKPDGYVAPIKITGTYNHPSFALDLGDRNNDKNHTAKTHHLTDPAKH